MGGIDNQGFAVAARKKEIEILGFVVVVSREEMETCSGGEGIYIDRGNA